MRIVSNLFVVLGVFCLVAGATLGLWGKEVAGTLYLVVLACAFAYLAKESREYGDEPADVDEPETVHASTDGGGGAVDVPRAHDVAYHASAPTITPLLFAIGAGTIVLGLVFSYWVVAIGGLVMATVAIAWFIETGKRHADEEAAKAAHGHGDDHR